MKAKVLIIGKVPPPIGGVTIHLSRFLDALEQCYRNEFYFFDLSKGNWLRLIGLIPQYAVVHLHTSSTHFQFILSVYCRILSKPLIITYHGNLGRYSPIRSYLEIKSIACCTIPIVQNSESYQIARKRNPHTHQITTYLPPQKIDALPPPILEELNAIKMHYKYIFCTNAWNVTFDQFGNEIYGISKLLDYSDHFKNSILIVSDPSGNYRKRTQQFHPHVYWITIPHDFCAVLQIADAFIRNTTTDATCLSIQEALSYEKVVFASNCVSRPSPCILYQDIQDISMEAILELEKEKASTDNCLQSESLQISDFIWMYQKLLRNVKFERVYKKQRHRKLHALFHTIHTLYF
jgi:hypothetical protein